MTKIFLQIFLPAIRSIFQKIIQHYLTSFNIISHHITPHHITSHRIASHRSWHRIASILSSFNFSSRSRIASQITSHRIAPHHTSHYVRSLSYGAKHLHLSNKLTRVWMSTLQSPADLGLSFLWNWRGNTYVILSMSTYESFLACQAHSRYNKQLCAWPVLYTVSGQRHWFVTIKFGRVWTRYWRKITKVTLTW